jgi:hypothetical protein
VNAIVEHTYYITFGVQYAHERHPRAINGVYPHPDGWFEIKRHTWLEAHEAAMAAFDGKFAFLYDEQHWSTEWFPAGKLGELK